MSGTYPLSGPLSGEPTGPPEAIHDEAMHDEIAHLHEAVQSQRDIGMAIGLLSARFACSTEQAWRTMLRVSQHSNTKVRQVARVLVRTHDGTADAEDRELLRSFVTHLPPSGWPEGPRTGKDHVP